MNINDCLKILRQIKDVAFATVDEKGYPQIRIIDVMIVEDEKLYFCTARGKEFYKQLIRDERVAIVGLNNEYQMVRLNGKAKKLNEQKKWIDRIFAENPSMNNVYPGDNRYVLEAFYIEEGTIEFFDLGKEPIYRESFVMNGGQIENKGYKITESCIQCGKCKKNCPQQCIKEGKPFLIEQEHCLHCGLCYEECPASAIISM